MAEGTADPEAILRRFTRSNVQHPTCKALAEPGKAAKTVFLCRYLGEEALRREIHEGLNVVETWNSANGFIFFGKGGEVAGNRLDDQEVSVHALHLLQYLLGVREYADATARAGRIRVDGAHDVGRHARADAIGLEPRQRSLLRSCLPRVSAFHTPPLPHVSPQSTKPQPAHPAQIVRGWAPSNG